VFFHDREGSLKGAHNRVKLVKGFTQIEVGLLLKRLLVDVHLEESIFDGLYFLGCNVWFFEAAQAFANLTGHHHSDSRCIQNEHTSLASV
jgi:hypothetical protein